MSEKVKRLPKLKVPALAGMWYTISSILERGSAIIFTPIYTRLLLPEAYGVYSIYTSFMGIVTVFATLEIAGGTVYRGLEEFKNKEEFLSSALGLISLSSLISFIFYLIFSARINSFTGLDTHLMLILFLQVFLNGVRALKISEAKFSYNRKLPLAEGIFFSVIIPLVSITLIIFSKEARYARIYASLAASVLFAAPIMFSILKKGSFKIFRKDVWSFLVKYTVPALPHYISISLIWQIGKIIVGNRFSSAEAGLLSLATSVGLLPTLLTLGMQSALLPWITRKLGEGAQGRRKIYSLILSVFFPLCLSVALFLIICPEVFRIMSGRNYLSALGAVYPIAASVPAVFLTNLLCAEISYYKKTHLVAIGSVLGSVFCLIFNLLFTFKLGFEFSAVLILPIFLFMTIVYFVILKRKFMHYELPAKKLLATYFIFLILVAFVAFIKISFLARVFLAIALVMMLLPKVKQLKPLYSE
ncbi:MAG: oligosaccharide flippase family protein [Clostridia bacterium]|nr:oligosaccharide flippase family protein [Clostridia bacterium]